MTRSALNSAKVGAAYGATPARPSRTGYRLGVALVCLQMVVPVSGRTGPAVPGVAGTLSISSEGTKGYSFEMPTGASLRKESISLTTNGATFAFIGIGPRSCDFTEGLCLSVKITWLYNTEGLYPELSGDDELEIAGIYDVYIISDGALKVDLVFDNAEAGALAETAVAPIDASFEPLVPNCADECDTFRSGGTSTYIHGTGFAGAAAYSSVPRHVATVAGVSFGNGGLVMSQACLYPNPFQPDASADPATHPNGCDVVNTSEPSITIPGGCPVGCFATSSWMAWGFSATTVYMGAYTGKFSAIGGARSAGYAFWIKDRIRPTA